MPGCQKEINSSDVPILIGCPNDGDLALFVRSNFSGFFKTPFNQLKACMLVPADIDLVVGNGDPRSPVVDSLSWTLSVLSGYRIRLWLDNMFITPCTDSPDGSYMTKPQTGAGSDTATLFGGLKFKAGMVIHLEFALASDDVAPHYIVEEDGSTQIEMEDNSGTIIQ